ncbi:hypothetical protein O9929_12730 [Vibrio lentus]|nr:hypothetical protein [Vibrio lentus]
MKITQGILGSINNRLDGDVLQEFPEQGGALYVYHAEQFDRFTLKFSQFARWSAMA